MRVKSSFKNNLPYQEQFGVDKSLKDKFEPYDRSIAINEMLWLGLIKKHVLSNYDYKPLIPSPIFIEMNPEEARHIFYNCLKFAFPNVPLSY